ncbi:MAG: YccF domain-containing protein [Suilimivivens sp.]
MITFILLLIAMTIVLGVLVLCFHLIGGVLGIGFHVVGGVLKLVFKLLICLPCALICALAGLVLCCTLILIPLGLACFKAAGGLLNPFRCCAI